MLSNDGRGIRPTKPDTSPFKVNRQLDEEKADDEMIIAENGPALQNADKTLKNAMDKYWGGQWHFIRKNSQFLKSKVLDRMKREPSKLQDV